MTSSVSRPARTRRDGALLLAMQTSDPEALARDVHEPRPDRPWRSDSAGLRFPASPPCSRSLVIDPIVDRSDRLLEALRASRPHAPRLAARPRAGGAIWRRLRARPRYRLRLYPIAGGKSTLPTADSEEHQHGGHRRRATPRRRPPPMAAVAHVRGDLRGRARAAPGARRPARCPRRPRLAPPARPRGPIILDLLLDRAGRSPATVCSTATAAAHAASSDSERPRSSSPTHDGTSDTRNRSGRRAPFAGVCPGPRGG